MSILDKIAEKARNTTGKKRGPALILSSIADYLAGTYAEMQAHKAELGKDILEDKDGLRDYQLYDKTTRRSTIAQGITTVLVSEYCPSKAVVYTLGADTTVRLANRIATSVKKDKESNGFILNHTDTNVTGIIGTARTLAYKLMGKLKCGKADAEAEFDDDDDPFEGGAFQMLAVTAVDAEEDDDSPDFGLDEKDDSGNTLF